MKSPTCGAFSYPVCAPNAIKKKKDYIVPRIGRSDSTPALYRGDLYKTRKPQNKTNCDAKCGIDQSLGTCSTEILSTLLDIVSI